MNKSLIPQSDFTEVTVTSKSAYEGKMLKVYEDHIHTSEGKPAKREWVDHPGAVIVLATLDNGHVVLERQYRYPVRKHMIELPAGKIEAGEDTLKTAQRELLEETGYVASEWKHLMTLHPCVGYSNERIEFYHATSLSMQTRQLDEGEFLDVFTLSLSDALGLVDSGHITDVKTIAGLLWLERSRNQR